MFDLCFNFLAAMTFEEKMLDAVTVTIVGMGIVFVSLFVMGEIFKLLGSLLIPKPVPEEAVAAPPVTQPGTQTGGIDPKLLVVLSAAAAATTRTLRSSSSRARTPGGSASRAPGSPSRKAPTSPTPPARAGRSRSWRGARPTAAPRYAGCWKARTET